MDKIYLYAKDLEPKYQLLIKKKEQAGIKNLEDKNAFIEWMIFMIILKIIAKKEKQKYYCF